MIGDGAVQERGIRGKSTYECRARQKGGEPPGGKSGVLCARGCGKKKHVGWGFCFAFRGRESLRADETPSGLN